MNERREQTNKLGATLFPCPISAETKCRLSGSDCLFVSITDRMDPSRMAHNNHTLSYGVAGNQVFNLPRVTSMTGCCPIALNQLEQWFRDTTASNQNKPSGKWFLSDQREQDEQHDQPSNPPSNELFDALNKYRHMQQLLSPFQENSTKLVFRSMPDYLSLSPRASYHRLNIKPSIADLSERDALDFVGK